jgi:hypothetical protein
MNDLNKSRPGDQHISANDLRRLPVDQRRAILEVQAALAEGLYRNDLH